MHRRPAALAAALLLAGTAAVVAAPAQAAPTCGTVTYPADGTVGTVELRSADLDCATALRVINQYVTDTSQSSPDESTEPLEFDGWLCSSPTAEAAAEYGYSTTCSRGDSFTAFVVVPLP